MKHRTNYKLFILPAIVLTLFAFTIFGICNYEKNISNLYREHTLLLKTVKQNPDALKQFSENINLSKSEADFMKLSETGQRVVDFLTFGTPHCLIDKQRTCRVYRDDLIIAAELRQKQIVLMTGKLAEDPIARAHTYKWYEIVINALTLFIEAFIISKGVMLFLKARK